jgi:sulfur transfer complex TusBCD TusB component (DsrH family)
MIIKETEYNINKMYYDTKKVKQFTLFKNKVDTLFLYQDSILYSVRINEYNISFNEEKDAIHFYDIVNNYLHNLREEKLKRILEE